MDEYLAWLHEVHPTNATFDGVHLHDDLIEDLSRAAIDAQVRDRDAARASKDFARADAIRKELAATNVELLDGESGTTWRVRQ